MMLLGRHSMMHLFCAFLACVSFSVSIVVVAAAAAATSPPSPTSPTSSPSNRDSFAVGVDLTDSYGVAAIHWADGKLQLAAMRHDPEYAALMGRYAQDSSRHSAPPYEYWHDGGAVMGMDDLPRQLQRRARKLVGLPASTEVALLSRMLTDLRNDAERVLNEPAGRRMANVTGDGMQSVVDKIVLTSPELAGLYDEDLYDAALHSGLELLWSPNTNGHTVYDPERNVTESIRPSWVQRQPKHAHALFAAYGLAGDSHHPLSPSLDPALTQRNILVAHLTQQGLGLTPQIKWTNRSCDLSWAQHVGYYNEDLGWSYELPREDWRRGIKDMLDHVVEQELRNGYQNHGDQNITDIIFAGEFGAEAVFRQTLLDFVSDLPGQTVTPELWPRLGRGAGHAEEWTRNGASYGAAKMAWQLLTDERPLEFTENECWWEDRRNLNHASGIQYATTAKWDMSDVVDTMVGFLGTTRQQPILEL